MDTLPVPSPSLSAVPMPALSAEAIEKALMVGDLSKMTPEVRIQYYLATCQSAGLNPLTRPFTALKTQTGEVVLYANKDAAEQLRAKHHMSLRVVRREFLDDTLWCVTVEGSLPSGRSEEGQGIVDLAGLKGQHKANKMLACETKAKRRVTLGLCGLGISFADDMPGIPARFSPQTGELFEDAPHLLDTASPAQAAEELFGDRGGASMRQHAPPTPDISHEALMAQIEAALTDGGADIPRYWGKVKASFVVDDPRHLTTDQLSGLLLAVQADVARRAAVQADVARRAAVHADTEPVDETPF